METTMETFDASRVLFIGLGATAVAWYRCYLPAMYLGADWVGLAGEPPEMLLQTGLAKGQTAMPDLADYDVVVMQQPRGRGWFRMIKRLQSQGTKVLFEVDDYLHAIRKMEHHDYKEYFDKEQLSRLELCMRAADGLICSTEFIARRYRRFNPNVYICENGLDTARYELARPERDTVTVGWVGATGHVKAVVPWLGAVSRVMIEHGNVCFVSIGMAYADALAQAFPGRALSIPFTMVDTYPAAMTTMDVALAPAAKGEFFRGKSDLRWLEAGALGIPVVADPRTYPKIEHGVTGFHASTPEEATEVLLEIVADPELRTTVGENARRYVMEKRDMSVACRQWAAVFSELVAPAAAASEG